jgi:hypothetical protein
MEQVPFAVVAAIEGLGVEALQTLHPAVEVGLGCAHEKVEVVAHEAVREACPRPPADDVGEAVQESNAVPRVDEDRQARDSTIEHVVHAAGDQWARWSGHPDDLRRTNRAKLPHTVTPRFQFAHGAAPGSDPGG